MKIISLPCLLTLTITLLFTLDPAFGVIIKNDGQQLDQGIFRVTSLYQEYVHKDLEELQGWVQEIMLDTSREGDLFFLTDIIKRTLAAIESEITKDEDISLRRLNHIAEELNYLRFLMLDI